MGTIDLNLLTVFVAVADGHGFSAAARRLDMPKSSVSRAIAALEAALGVRLVHRTTRKVALSTAGAALRDRLAGPLAGLDAALGALAELEEQPSGRLRVTAAVDFGTIVLPELVARFAARHPLIELELNVTNAMVDLVAEGFDLGVRMAAGRRLADSSLAARRLGTMSLQLYAAPSYLVRRGTPRTVAELEGHDWVTFRKPMPIRLEGPTGAVTVTPRGRIVGDEMLFVREAAVHGAGLVALPTFIGDAAVARGELDRVLPRLASPSGAVWLIVPSTRHLPRKVVAFRDFLIEELGPRLR